MSLVRRLSAVVLAISVAAGNAAVCAGWAATPEARMACCSEGAACPMHKSASDAPGSQRSVTQAQADSCCASSERQDHGSSGVSSTFAIAPPLLGSAIILPPTLPALIVSDEWRISTPVSPPPVPRHLLLSVFLV